MTSLVIIVIPELRGLGTAFAILKGVILVLDTRIHEPVHTW
ncbi:UNVERIFIED_ORG: hypothetical protein BCL66_103161 [Martelella mediterranea]